MTVHRYYRVGNAIGTGQQGFILSKLVNRLLLNAREYAWLVGLQAMQLVTDWRHLLASLVSSLGAIRSQVDTVVYLVMLVLMEIGID